MSEPDHPVTPDQIKAVVAREVSGFDVKDRSARMTLEDFKSALREPCEVTVNFSGGLTQECWSVTRSDGAYRLIYMPKAGYFSLCVESQFGPLDIGVHGPAVDCFGSV